MPHRSSAELRLFIIRLLIIIGLIALALAIWQVRHAVLLGFAAVVAAVVLLAAADPLQRIAGLSHRVAVIITILAILLVFGLLGSLLGAQIVALTSEFAGQLPRAISAFEQRTGISLPDANELKDHVTGNGLGGLFGQLASWGWSVVNVATSLVLVVIAGVFFALDPQTYRRGLVKLFPREARGEINDGLIACGRGLRLWLMGQLVSMAIVGLLVWLGTWAIGLPTPAALGAIAGLAEFIPMVGPIISTVPALLFALSEGPSAVLWTLILFVAIQQLESNIIMPRIQQEMIQIPPALFLFSVVAFGVMFGFLGVVLAAPLTVVAYIAVNRFYIRDMLHESTDVADGR